MTEVAVAAFAFLGIAILLAQPSRTGKHLRPRGRYAARPQVALSYPAAGFRSLRGLYFISGRQAACGRLPELTN